MAAVGRSLRAIVRCIPDDNSLTVALLLQGSAHTLQRKADETLDKSLTRISLTLLKSQKKEMKKAGKSIKKGSKGHVVSAPVVKLYDKDEKEEIPLDTPNVVAWREGAWLHVEETRYEISVNPPSVRNLEVMSCVMVGSPIVPQADFEFTDPSLSQWRWWWSDGDSPLPHTDTELLDKSRLDPSLSPPAPPDHLSIHTNRIYYPTDNDVGKKLLIQCIPINNESGCGHPTYFQTKPVFPSPELGPLVRRHLKTPWPLQSSHTLRVVSYNILADCYSTTDYATDVLYPYCSPEALNPDYRMGVVAREVLGYCPDIVCMQEVSKKWFDNYLLPVLEEKGFKGTLAVKTGSVPEGEATFFNASKYSCIETFKISVSHFLQHDPLCSGLYNELTKAPTVLGNVTKKHTILQLSLLRTLDQPNRYILVGNTHLCYHPTEDHIRLIQAVTCIKAFERVLTDFKSSFNPMDIQPEVAVVFCGDFNSCPCTGGYKFITKGCLESTHCNWTQYKYPLIPRCGCCEVLAHEADYIMNFDPESAATHQTVMGAILNSQNGTLPIIQDEFTGIHMTHPLSLQDSCGPLPYTNYTVGFKACLDYIFSDRRLLSVDRVIPLPDHSEVMANIALPSVVFPSDHLALVCDLKWND